MLPFSDKVLKLLKEYLVWRKKLTYNYPQYNNYMFINKKGGQLKLSTLQEAFRAICKESDICRKGYYNVRLQDLRHTFATNRVTQWYEQGEDVQKLLPLLSTYMGHCNIDSTSVYICITGKLLEKASLMFKNYVDL